MTGYGGFVWQELVSSDPEAAKVFLEKLLGWEEGDETGVLYLRPGDGAEDTPPSPVASVVGPVRRERSDEPRSARVSHWVPFALVDGDLGEAVGSARDSGCAVACDPHPLVRRTRKVRDGGHFAVVASRESGPLGLMRAGEDVPPPRPARLPVPPGNRLPSTVRRVCWHELTTPRPEEAARQLTALGWSFAGAEEREGERRRRLCPPGSSDPVATLRGVGVDVPPHWLPYVHVADVDETARLAGELGGEVLVAPAAIDGDGRYAVLREPGGAPLGLYQPPAGDAKAATAA